VSQTEGAELPDLKERVKGDVGEYRERLIAFILAQGRSHDPCDNMSSANRLYRKGVRLDRGFGV
jgi:hypothetical protein